MLDDMGRLLADPWFNPPIQLVGSRLDSTMKLCPKRLRTFGELVVVPHSCQVSQVGCMSEPCVQASEAREPPPDAHCTFKGVLSIV